jgi:hypothetical protein
MVGMVLGSRGLIGQNDTLVDKKKQPEFRFVIRWLCSSMYGSFINQVVMLYSHALLRLAWLLPYTQRF